VPSLFSTFVILLTALAVFVVIFAND